MSALLQTALLALFLAQVVLSDDVVELEEPVQSSLEVQKPPHFYILYTGANVKRTSDAVYDPRLFSSAMGKRSGDVDDPRFFTSSFGKRNDPRFLSSAFGKRGMVDPRFLSSAFGKRDPRFMTSAFGKRAEYDPRMMSSAFGKRSLM